MKIEYYGTAWAIDYKSTSGLVIINESAPESQKMAKMCLKTIKKSLSEFKKTTICNELKNLFQS